MKKRVVITGLGAVTPVGNTVETFWDSIKKEQIGIGEITRFDTSDYKVKLAAEVKSFKATDYMDVKAARRMELFARYAVAAARQAYEDSGLDISKEDPYEAGVIIGSGVGSLPAMEREYGRLLAKGPARVSPMFVPMMISNMAAGNVSIQLGFRGKCTNVVTACASGTHCIGDALRAIQYGDATMMLAGGTESCICESGVAGFMNLTALSTVTDPARASIPFDQDRSGFVLGEGAGVVMLEELTHAKNRGAHIYAELCGYGATGDAYHITSPEEDGAGAARAMELAMQEAGVQPSEVTYINAHGTGTHHNDLFETRAIHRAFGESAYQVHINSTKSMIGHLLGGAGGVEMVATVLAIRDGWIHPTVGTHTPDPECDLNYTVGAPAQMEISCALTNSLGFGGHNASLLLKRYQE